MNDIKFKKWLFAGMSSAVTATLVYFFKYPIISFLEYRITVPIYLFPLVSIGTLCILFLIRWSLTFRNQHLKFVRSIIVPGMRFGIKFGPGVATAIEWSWLNPNYIIAQTDDGSIIRIHHSLISLFF